MKRTFLSALAALSLMSFAGPAHSQPATTAASVFRSASGFAFQCTTVAHNCVTYSSISVNVLSMVSVDNVSGTVTPTADFNASANGGGCNPACTSWYAPPQIVSPTAFQMDPIGNTASLVANLKDTTNVMHAINITFTRPTFIQVANNTPNPWVDGQSAQVRIDYVALNRSGYVLNGTVDSAALVNTPCGASGLCGGSGGGTSTWLQGTYAQVN